MISFENEIKETFQKSKKEGEALMALLFERTVKDPKRNLDELAFQIRLDFKIVS